MPKCSEVATELRRIVEALESTPDAVCVKAVVGMYCDTKAEFLTAARVMPRPFKESTTSFSTPKLDFTHSSDVLLVCAQVPLSIVGDLVEPAKPAVYHLENLDAAIAEAVQ